jgi:DNA-binding LytR/AlgR family response regulator
MIKAIAIDDEPMALKVIETLCSKFTFLTLEKSFTKPYDALKYLNKFPADLVFIDINMPSISGINLVKQLEQNTMVIFTTAFSQYAVESYELNAIDYLLKPISLDRFSKSVNKALEYYNFQKKSESNNSKYLFVRADFSLTKILTDDILYIEGLADYLKIHVRNSKTIVVRMTMKEMIDKLSANDFIRIHRSFIVPFNKIISVRNNVVKLETMEFAIGKTFITSFFERYTSN